MRFIEIRIHVYTTKSNVGCIHVCYRYVRLKLVRTKHGTRLNIWCRRILFTALEYAGLDTSSVLITMASLSFLLGGGRFTFSIEKQLYICETGTLKNQVS